MRGSWFGPYELLRKIAAGGMAEIFLARRWGDAGFYRDVVVKKLFSHLAEHEASLLGFQYEARLMGELSHPNIPQIYDLGFADETWYIAMEYVGGMNLADLWRAGAKQGRPMTMPVALGIIMQVCDALHHAHEAHDRAGNALEIVHRDVTPQNVVVTRDGVAKLMDFGIAQTAANRDEAKGVVRGTLSYMAPEQVRGKRLDRRADVFALGVVLYELTTGTRLFRGRDVQVMTAIVERDVAAPSSIVPGYPEALEAIVMACLRRDRDSRIASAFDLGLHLEHFAMQNGMLPGPRQVAKHVQAVVPRERIIEPELALVDSVPPKPRSAGLLDRERDVSAYALPLSVPIGRVGDEEVLDLDELEPVEASGEISPAPFEDEEARQVVHGVAVPGGLPSFDEPADATTPVVLLESRKPHAEERDYLESLTRRLDED